MWRHWFPVPVDRAVLEPRMNEFYSKNAAYHQMTSGEGKAEHPQVRILECLLQQGGSYVEVGCGGGEVCSLIGKHYQVTGVDVSRLALQRARDRSMGGMVTLIEASADHLPIEENSADGVYSFEVLEHVWDPLTALREMVRIIKPGGFLLVSMPNHFSLDMHLRHRFPVRLIEGALALLRKSMDVLRGATFRNIEPEIDGEIYPDCDMITSFCPGACAPFLREIGCEVDFVDTTYMCAHRRNSMTDLDFQKKTAHRIFRDFGDHLLILAHKK